MAAITSRSNLAVFASVVIKALTTSEALPVPRWFLQTPQVDLVQAPVPTQVRAQVPLYQPVQQAPIQTPEQGTDFQPQTLWQSAPTWGQPETQAPWSLLEQQSAPVQQPLPQPQLQVQLQQQQHQQMAAQMTEQLPLRQQGLGLLGMPAQRVQQMTTGTSNEAALLQTISSLQSGILRLETQLDQERLREQHLAAMATKFSQQLSSVEAQQTQEHQHLLSSNAEVAHLYERLNKTMVEESKLASLEEEAEKAAKSAVAQAQTERSRAEAERVRAMQAQEVARMAAARVNSAEAVVGEVQNAKALAARASQAQKMAEARAERAARAEKNFEEWAASEVRRSHDWAATAVQRAELQAKAQAQAQLDQQLQLQQQRSSETQADELTRARINAQDQAQQEAEMQAQEQERMLSQLQLRAHAQESEQSSHMQEDQSQVQAANEETESARLQSQAKRFLEQQAQDHTNSNAMMHQQQQQQQQQNSQEQSQMVDQPLTQSPMALLQAASGASLHRRSQANKGWTAQLPTKRWYGA